MSRRYHVLALSSPAGIATLCPCIRGRTAADPRRRPAQARSWACWAILSFRTPGLVRARYRQAQANVAADDGPPPRPSTPVLTPACVPAVLAPDTTGCSIVHVRDEASSPPIPERLSRSPPAP